MFVKGSPDSAPGICPARSIMARALQAQNAMIDRRCLDMMVSIVGHKTQVVRAKSWQLYQEIRFDILRLNAPPASHLIRSGKDIAAC